VLIPRSHQQASELRRDPTGQGRGTPQGLHGLDESSGGEDVGEGSGVRGQLRTLPEGIHGEPVPLRVELERHQERGENLPEHIQRQQQRFQG
jgi:hypothetical protein